MYGECSSVGRAPDCGSGCRGFEPHRSPHFFIMLIIISGPSGVGKGTVIYQLLALNPSLALCVSATTRSPRNNEINGEAYHFLTNDEFKANIDNGDFLEWCQVHQNFYGTPISEVQSKLSDHSAVIIEIDVQGAQKIRKQPYDQFHIFLAPPSIEILKQRLIIRNSESELILNQRIDTATQEMNQRHLYDEIIINDELTQTVNHVHNLILKTLAEGVS